MVRSWLFLNIVKVYGCVILNKSWIKWNNYRTQLKKKLLEAASEFDNIDIVETEKPQVLKKLILKRN